MRLYVASSWRNQKITEVVAALRAAGHHVYDFREDDGEGSAFNWRDIDLNWKNWTVDQYLDGLEHPAAEHGFNRDMDALNDAEGLLLVLPCGRSAHLELGIAIGRTKPTCVLLEENQEPELMYKAVDELASDVEEAIQYFEQFEERRQKSFRPVAGQRTKARDGIL